jgi:hypothetical protein
VGHPKKHPSGRGWFVAKAWLWFGGPRDDSESTGQRQGGSTEWAVGKYDSFPMDAITERGYFAGEKGDFG